MRVSELVTEAWRNLGVRSWLFAVALVASIAICTASTVLVAQSSLDQARAEVRAGSLTWQATPVDGATITARECEGLERMSDITTGGVLVDRPQLAAIPLGLPLPVIHVTPGFVEAWFGGQRQTSPVLGRTLAKSSLVADGGWLFDGTNPVGRVAGVMQRVPDTEAETSVLIATAEDGPLSRCVFRVPAGWRDSGPTLSAWAFGQRANVARVWAPSAGTLTPAEQWRRGMAVQPWLIAASLPLLVLALGSLTRRSELAVYRAFGASRSLVVALLSVETWLVALPAIPLGLLLGLVVPMRPIEPSALWAALTQGGASALMVLACTPLFVLPGVLGQVFASLKDR